MKDDTWIGRVFMTTALILACAGLTWAAAPQAVSPGSVDHVVEINDSCPTFSWGVEPDWSEVELVAYRLDEGLSIADLRASDLGEWNEVLYTTIPGNATSWTPAIEEGLAPGDRYVWFVRGVTVDADGKLVEAGAWSRAKFFSIPARPTEEQLQNALELVQRYLAAQGASGTTIIDPPTARVASERVQRAQTDDSEDSEQPLRSVPSATAAIRGGLPDTTGESYGVVGTSASVDGAGLAAVNTAGGADLVLDGSEDSSAADAEFRESGIARPSATDEIFAFSNPGAGGITLEVAGDIEVENVTATGVFTGDGSGLTGISYTETDPVFGAAAAFGITTTDLANWTSAYNWGDHTAVGYDASADSWAGTGTYDSTTAMVGVGMAGAPSAMFHVLTSSAPGVPQVLIDEAGSGDAFEWFTLSGSPVDYSTGIDSVDQNFKITGSSVLTGGAGSSQGDGITMMQTTAQGIMDFDNQSRARAELVFHPQAIPFGTWTAIEFDGDSPPFGYDQHGEFVLSAGPGTPGTFVPTVAGYYQVNARTEFVCTETPVPLLGGYVAIAIFVNGIPYAEGNNLQIVHAGAVMYQNNAPNVSDVVYLNPGDVVEIMVYQSYDGGLGAPLFAGPLAPPGKTYVSVHKVS